MPNEIVVDDFLVEILIHFLEIRLVEGDIPTDGGEYPVYRAVEQLAADPQVRATMLARVTAAEDAGLFFALPSSQELAVTREKRLAR